MSNLLDAMEAGLEREALPAPGLSEAVEELHKYRRVQAELVADDLACDCWCCQEVREQIARLSFEAGE